MTRQLFNTEPNSSVSLRSYDYSYRWTTDGCVIALRSVWVLALLLLCGHKTIADTAHLILIPGTSPQYLAPNLPTGDKSIHPALGEWVPHQNPILLQDARNTGDAIVDMIKSKLPPGTALDVSVFAKGAPGEKLSSWVGENSDEARQKAGNELALEINAIPKNDLLILAGFSHGDTVATLAANQSQHGVDLKVSFDSPGIVAPAKGSIGSAINFYNPNDSVATHAGSSDFLSQGPSSSPGRITNPGGYVANIPSGQQLITDNAGNLINPPTMAGIDDHSYNVDPRIIDGEISSKFNDALASMAAVAGISDPVGDLISVAGKGYSSPPPSRANPQPQSPKDPFSLLDPNASLVSRPTGLQNPSTAFTPKNTPSNSSSSTPPNPESAPVPAATGGLSNVRVAKRNIRVTLTDNGKYIDGDTVHLMLNGHIIVSNHVLKGPPGTTFSLTLAPGNNILQVYAVNEGDVPPNTAELKISDVISGPDTQVYSAAMDETASMTVTLATASGRSGLPSSPLPAQAPQYSGSPTLPSLKLDPSTPSTPSLDPNAGQPSWRPPNNGLPRPEDPLKPPWERDPNWEPEPIKDGGRLEPELEAD